MQFFGGFNRDKATIFKAGKQHAGAKHTGCRGMSAGMLFAMLLVVAGCGGGPDEAEAQGGDEQAQSEQAKPALTVTTVEPTTRTMTQSMTASGNVAAWQEASVGAEVPGLRITSVRANVGDWVNKGQLLATFETSSVDAQTAELDASIAEAKVNLTEAQLNAARFTELEGTGAVSDFQISQARAQAQAATKRLDALRASKKAQTIRTRNTRVLAPDSGVISARGATVGAVAGTGTELFRIIRGGRLEWRGEVTASERAKLEAGMPVTVYSPSGLKVNTRIRALSPSINSQTRKAVVYAELPTSKNGSSFAAGMFVKGDIALGERTVTVLPRQSVILRDGFHYVFTVQPNNTVKQLKVDIGKQQDGQIEIITPLVDGVTVVANGAGFLNDGDVVDVVGSSAVTATSTGAVQ